VASSGEPKTSDGSEFRLQAAVLCARPASVVVGAVLSALKMEPAGAMSAEGSALYSQLAKIVCQNLFARQGASHLINLAKTIRLHAYATNIQN